MQDPRPVKSGVSAEAKAQIDENLKRVYEAALNEEVPDRFKELLAQLKAQEEAKGGRK